MAHVGRAGVSALAGLIVLDVVLVAFAVQHVRDGDDATAVPPSTAQEPAGSTSNDADGPDDEKADTDDAEEPAEDQASALELPGDPTADSQPLVNRGENDAVMRAATGVCGEGGGAVELSSDGGESFDPVELPDEAQVILRVVVTDAESSWVVGTDQDCGEYTIYRSEDGGQTWDTSPGSEGAWHPTRTQGRQTQGSELHAPYAMATAPCPEEASLATISVVSEDTAYLLCADGTVIRTQSAGADWSERGEVLPEALAVEFTDVDTGVLVTAGVPAQVDGGEEGQADSASGEGDEGAADCTGLAVLTSEDGGDTWTPRDCLESSGTGYAGISMSENGRAFLAHGDQLWFSEDSGESWEQRGAS